jgi:hypothetical protein
LSLRSFGYAFRSVLLAFFSAFGAHHTSCLVSGAYTQIIYSESENVLLCCYGVFFGAQNTDEAMWLGCLKDDGIFFMLAFLVIDDAPKGAFKMKH